MEQIMGNTTTRASLAAAALLSAIAATLALAGASQAATFLDTDELTRFCSDKYGAEAIGEGPTVGTFNRIDMQCAVPDASSDGALVHAQTAEDVCTFLTGYDAWVNDRGVIVCIGQASFGNDTHRGSHSD
jgi:hypothetical protein